MIFCLGDGQYQSKGAGFQKNNQIFNVLVDTDVFDKAQSALQVKNFKLPIARWVDIKDIEKPTTTQKQIGGYLKTLSYKDAWAEMWEGLSTEDKPFFKTLPNFNAELFEKITGIKYEVTPSLSGKKISVELDGQKYTATID